MNSRTKTTGRGTRVETLLRTPDAAPWSAAPSGLHDRVMASLDAAPIDGAGTTGLGTRRVAVAALAASLAIVAGAAGLIAGASLWKQTPGEMQIVQRVSGTGPAAAALPVQHAGEAPTVVVSRVFGQMRPAPSARLVESVAAPMRTEAEGLAAETRLAARTVFSQLPFVSMD